MKEKRIIYLIMGVCSILILLIGITTAWFEWRSEVDTNVTFNVEGLNITYEGEPTVIKGNLYPTMYMNNTDNVIHNFSLVTTSNIEIYSKISLEIITLPTELNHESFRWNLYKDSTQIASGSFQNASVGTDVLLTPYETITTTKSNYTLYIWIDGENYNNPLTMGGKTFEFKLKLEASQQDYATAEECFEFDENTQTITKYLCNGGGTATEASYSVDDIKKPSSKYMSLSKVTPIDTTTTQSYPLITDVVIPKTINGVTVKYIGDKSFANCGNGIVNVGPMAYVESDNNISILPFNNDKNIVMNKMESSDCKLTSVVIPDSVTTIGIAAFGQNALTNVVISDSVTTIGASAFRENNLTSVVIPNSVTSIGNSAFQSNNLTSVVIPNSVTSIGNSAFQSNNLTSVVIPDSVTTIGSWAFALNNLTSVVIPNGVTEIGSSAFYLNKLTSVVIPDSVTTIGASAFRENNLTSVVIPNSVTSIGNSAFRENSLTSVVIPDSVTTIGEYAFQYNSLTSVVIPNSVITIEKSVFESNKLTSVVIPGSVTSIGNSAFMSNNLISVVIPDSVTTIGDSAFRENNLTSVVIPDGVTTIGNYVFCQNNFTSVVIPDNVTTIGDSAFYKNNLTSVVIPDSVMAIGNNAFSYNNLSSVYIGANSNLTETTGISYYAFSSSNRTYTSSSTGNTYVDNPNLTTIYNNSGKKFKWYYVTQDRNNSTSSTYNFITGTVPSYNSYNEVTITTGGNP